MRMNPAACSNAFAPIFGTFKRSLRLTNLPFASLYATMLAAVAFVIPEMYWRSGADAVFRSTPTSFTQSSTTASSDSPSFFWSPSC
jgi:hypothetical protein